MPLHGKNYIGSEQSAQGNKSFQAINPINNEKLPTQFFIATKDEIDNCCNKANQAFTTYRKTSGTKKAQFLRQIAINILALDKELIETAVAETGLPEMRIQGERGRTCGQLNLFADLVEDGSWVDARIDTAIPDRQPLPKPDIRSMERSIGAVAIFGASNFPLAFSTAGGDTASALAAGCPVVYKGHPAHPGTTELVSQAIINAVKKCNLPEGTFSMFHSNSPEGGQALVSHPEIKAVGFTGSTNAGRAIFNTAAMRHEPIPVYAEMGSSNPVFILPKALELKGSEIANGLAASVCLGAGQFCTNPGMTVLLEGEESKNFINETAQILGDSPAGTVVHSSIKDNYERDLTAKLESKGIELLARSQADTQNTATAVQPALFKSDAETFMQNKKLSHEVFGPCTFVITANSYSQLLKFIDELDGHLTATIFAEQEDFKEFADAISLLEKKVGRIIVNQYPTGVEVCSSMFHGGPYPASTSSRSTSVGTGAIYRFSRPVCYQNFPQNLLPEELQNSNPLKVNQMINGKIKI